MADPQQIPAELLEKWRTIVQSKYSDQAKWWLNAFLKEGAEQEAEAIWNISHLFIKYDDKRKEQGFELDEFWSHKVLEELGETLTVVDFRKKMREIDVDFNNNMSLIEYLLCRYKRSVNEVVEGAQGANREAIATAQNFVQEAQTSLDEMHQKLEDATAKKRAAQTAENNAVQAEASAVATAESARKAESSAKQTEEAAVKAEADAKAAEAQATAATEALKTAENENRHALEQLTKQQEDYHNKIKELETKKNEGSTVARGRASAELDQLKASDPLPLSRARISQEATLRKLEKARDHALTAQATAQTDSLAAQTARQKAEVDRQASEEATKLAESDAQKAAAAKEEAVKNRQAAEASQEIAEASVKESESKVAAAMQALEELKKAGTAFGDIWWLERELTEKQKYLPKRAQKK